MQEVNSCAQIAFEQNTVLCSFHTMPSSLFIVYRHLGETAFPSKEQIESILDALSGTSTDGMTIDDLQERCNLRRGQIENALKFLAAEEVAPIRRVLLTGSLLVKLSSSIVNVRQC